MAQSCMSLMDTAATLIIPSFPKVYQWKKQFEVGGLDALEPKRKGHPSMKNKHTKHDTKRIPAEGSIEALQAELERLRMENAYLKNLNALVQNKGKLPTIDVFRSRVTLSNETVPSGITRKRYRTKYVS